MDHRMHQLWQEGINGDEQPERNNNLELVDG